jgi:hypothetical protein
MGNAECGERKAEGRGFTEMPPLRGLGCCWPCRVLQRWRAYGARVVGRNGLRNTEISALRGLGCLLGGRVLQRFRPYGAWGVFGGRVPQNTARIHQIEHRRCDFSVAARATPPKLRQERHRRGLGVLLAVSGSAEMPPLRGLMYVGKRFEENRDGAPTALGLWDETV